jgi:small GTP-binding protein domain/GTP-binding conserved hypothetical protein
MEIKKSELKFTIFSIENLAEIDLPAICIIGRSNAGKSSFINTIVGKKKFAYVSSTPGKTRSLNFYLINDQFYLVDFPGYGYGAISDLTKKGWNQLIDSFFQIEKIKKYIFFLIDCRRQPDNIDYELIDYLRENKLPILFILTKIDKITKSKISGIKSFFIERFKCDKNLVIPYSSLTKDGKDKIFNYIENIVLEN